MERNISAKSETYFQERIVSVAIFFSIFRDRVEVNLTE